MTLGGPFACGPRAIRLNRGRSREGCRFNGKERPIPRPKRKTPPASAKLLSLVEKSLDDDKAEDIVVIDLAGKTEIADFMVIASGTSQRQIGAMAQHLRNKIKDARLGSPAVEGGASDWVLIDAGDVVVHLFRPETRQFYDLEKFWTMTPAEMRASLPA